jgi:hypothetical protein
MKVIAGFIVFGILGLISFYTIDFHPEERTGIDDEGVLHARTTSDAFYMKKRHAQNASITVSESLFSLENTATIYIPTGSTYTTDAIASWYNELLGKCKAKINADGIDLVFGQQSLQITEDTITSPSAIINIHTTSIMVASETMISLGAEHVRAKPYHFRDPFGNVIRLKEVVEEE